MEKPTEDFFGKKGYLSRVDLREGLRQAPPKFTGSARRYTRQEREAFEKKFDFKRYGSNIDRKDVKGLIKGLQKEKVRANWQERKKINNDINYLKKLGDF